MTLKFRINMINVLKLKLNLRIKKKKTKIILLKILNKSKTLKKINVVELLNKNYKQK